MVMLRFNLISSSMFTTFTRRRSFCSYVWASSIKYASTPEQALHLYTQMHSQSIPFNTYAMLFTLKSCAPLKNPTLIHHLHALIFKSGFSSHVYVATSLLNAYVMSSFQHACQLFDEIPEKNTVTWNTMITGFFKYYDVKMARRLFDSMTVRDLSTWSAMIAGYMNCGRWNEGLELFREMMVVDVDLKPDEVTVISILSGCTRMGSLGLFVGKGIHCFVEKNGWQLSVGLETALVDMYSKCGLLKNGIGIFERMQERNVTTWTAMICGLAHHGWGNEALLLFERMIEEDVRPNELTLTGILIACNHVGLVEEGKELFHNMIEEYELEPRIQHYGCMVDLLGKSGRVEEAYELIESMRIEPNVVVLTSLLVACKEHKQYEMAERVIERVLKMVTPEKNGGVYTLISDLYALNNKWEEAELIREMMVKQNVKKIAGSSCISATRENDNSPLRQPTTQQVMIDTISKGLATVFLIGAHTNFAVFLMNDPRMKKNVEHIYIMGGGVRLKNPTGCCPDSVLNIFGDPLLHSRFFILASPPPLCL